MQTTKSHHILQTFLECRHATSFKSDLCVLDQFLDSLKWTRIELKDPALQGTSAEYYLAAYFDVSEESAKRLRTGEVSPDKAEFLISSKMLELHKRRSTQQIAASFPNSKSSVPPKKLHADA